MHDLNRRSWRVAERCAFAREGILRNNSRRLGERLEDTRVHAKIRPDDTPGA